MKLNKIFLFASLAVVTLFTACKDDDDSYAPGQWDANPGYANVYFQQTSYSESIDPTAPTEFTFEVYRHVEHEYVFGKDSLGNIIPDSIISDKILTDLPAITVTPTVKVNTNNVFTISDATFAQGDTVGYFTAKFPTAEVGSPYTLKVALEGADYVSSYSSNVEYTYTVTRVKWNLLGKGTIVENYWIGESGNVEIYQRDDNPNAYRVMHPMDEMLASAALKTDIWDPAEFTGHQAEYIELTVNKGGIITYPEFNSGVYNLSYSAEMIIMHPSGRGSTEDASYWTYNKVLSYQADGKTPGQIQLAPWYFMYGVGGYNQTQKDGIIVITFPGFVPEYTATVEDYGWEEVFSGIFTSNQLGTKTPKIKLFKGVQDEDLAATEKGCYDRFEEAYGTPYYIESPYAEGYNLLFCINEDGSIVVPEDYESQPLGFKAVGQDVYGAIATKGSSFEDILLELNITFQSKDGSVKYGSATEQLLNFVYTKDMVLGDFTYKSVLASNGNEYDLGNFTIVEHPTEADSVIIKDLYLEGAEIGARVDLNEAKLYVENFGYLGIEEDEGTPYYIFTYSKSNSDDIAFDINTDGTLSSTDLILVGSPDLKNLYYWFNASSATFIPVKADASRRLSKQTKAVKVSKKGAKISSKGFKLSVK